MSGITQFPFPSGTAPESQVVEWLAEVLYPKKYRKGGYDKSKAKKRVRCRIHYARNIKKDRRPRRLKNGNIKVPAFFGWAILQKNGALAEVDGLPRDASRTSVLSPMLEFGEPMCGSRITPG